MTRDKEIIAEAQKHGLNCMSRINYQDGFIEGAKWADKTMIDKACEWLTKHLYDYDHIEGYEVFRDVNRFVKDFRKAMEE